MTQVNATVSFDLPAGAVGPAGPAGVAGPAGASGATGPAGPAGKDGVSPTVDVAALAKAVAAILAGAPPVVVTPPPTDGGGTTPPAGTGPDGSYVYYFDGVDRGPGDYNYNGAATNYKASPLVVDPLFPSQTFVSQTAYNGFNAGYQPRMPGDNLNVQAWPFLWVRVLPGKDTDRYFFGGALPGDKFLPLPGVALPDQGEVTKYATAPLKAHVWNWLRIPYQTILSMTAATTGFGLYKWSIVLAGDGQGEIVQFGYQGYSKV